MQAAAANMTAQPDGTLLPNPQGGPVGGVEPYPLTYVEYAMVPAQPLVNSDCTANTAAQTALNEWLTYVVGAGQQDLPSGMAPLPSSLTAQAQTAIAKVGTGAAACTPASATPGSNTTSSAATPSGAGASNTTSAFGNITPGEFANSNLLSLAEAKAASGSKSGKGAGEAGTAARAAALSLAAFGKVPPEDWALPLLGILVLTLLIPGLVYWASRRSRGVLGELEPASAASDPQAPSPVDGGAET
jgi:hypothetical protein